MGVVAELILIRHGQSASNVAFPEADAAGRLDSGLSGRDADVELTGLGARQAAALGRWLAGRGAGRVPQTVVTSPYLRARETWRLAAQASGLDLPAPGTDDRLVDRLTGDLEMHTRAAIGRLFPDEAGRRERAGEYQYTPPGGESFADIAVRLTSFLDDLNRDHAGERVVVVAHDAVVMMTRFVVQGLTWDDIVRISARGGVMNASVTRFDGSSGRLLLDVYNSIDHLPEPSPVPARAAAPDEQGSPPDQSTP